MAQSKNRKAASADTAYAEAAAAMPVKKPAKPLARKAPVKQPAPIAAEPIAAEPIAAEPIAAEPIAAEPVVEAVIEPVAELALEPVAEPALLAEPAEPEITVPVAAAPAAPIAKTPLISLKDISMTTDFTATITDTVTQATSEVQAKFQQAFDKSSAMVAEMTDLAKGNVEAVVESGKLFAAGVQDMGKSYAVEAKSAYETATADFKEMAAIKSPTELFQLQGKILRRNFDAFVAATSKSTDAALKLANDTIAPISGRVNVAAEKLSKVAA